MKLIHQILLKSTKSCNLAIKSFFRNCDSPSPKNSSWFCLKVRHLAPKQNQSDSVLPTCRIYLLPSTGHLLTLFEQLCFKKQCMDTEINTDRFQLFNKSDAGVSVVKFTHYYMFLLSAKRKRKIRNRSILSRKLFTLHLGELF